jgi:hypothetical protein
MRKSLLAVFALCAASGAARADSWSGWNSLGGGISGAPTAIMNLDGRLEIFALGGGNAIYHNYQTSPSGGWSGWTWMGGSLQQAPAVVMNADGRLELFGWGTDSALWHAWQQTAANSSSWSGWASLGGGIYANPAVNINSDGRLEVVVLGGGNAIWHIWQTSAGGAWSSYNYLGGNMAPGVPLAIGANADGRLEIFAQDTLHRIEHTFEQTAGNSSSYTSWTTFGQVPGGVSSAPAAISDYEGRLYVFVTGIIGPWTYYFSQVSPGVWGNEVGLVGAISSPAVTQNQDGRIEVFGVAAGGVVYHSWQTTPGGSFSGWASLGGTLSSSTVSAVMNMNGTLEIFGEWSNAAGYHDWQTTVGGGDAPVEPTPKPLNPPALPTPPGGTVGSLGYAILENVVYQLNPVAVYQPNSNNTAYAFCYNPSNQNDLIPCNLSLYTYAFDETNGHFHTNPPSPVSTVSPDSGYTGDYSNLQIPVTISTTSVGQIEEVEVDDDDDGYYYEFDYGVGYNTFTYVAGSNIFVQIGGNTNNHGDNTWNHWMTPSALSGLTNAAISYLNANNPGHAICINDMSLPIGGVFDYLHSDWMPPHIAHDKGTAVDVADTSKQCAANNVVIPGTFLKACVMNGAFPEHSGSLVEPGHVHCQWPH